MKKRMEKKTYPEGVSEPPLSRETFEDLHEEMDKLRRSDFLDPLPHSAAKLIVKVLEDIETTILSEAFGAGEIIAKCEYCEILIFDTDESQTDESGDCTFCMACVEEWRKEQEQEPPESADKEQPSSMEDYMHDVDTEKRTAEIKHDKAVDDLGIEPYNATKSPPPGDLI